MSLLEKGLGEKSSDNGGGGSGNNSDNSALISIGNTSFGFNFDSEEGNSPGNSNVTSEEGDSASDDGPGKTSKPKKAQTGSPSPAKVTSTSGSETSSIKTSSHSDAASKAVASLQSIATEAASQPDNGETTLSDRSQTIAVPALTSVCASFPSCLLGKDAKPAAKRKAQDSVDNDSGGYKSDDEEETSGAGNARSAKRGATAGASAQKGSKKKKKLDDMKREERNAREKERSFRISKQINELRNLLSSGGVIVPKGTKSSVLTEAANYIRMLQQHQYRSEM